MKEKSPESVVLRFVWLENLTQDYTNEEIGQIVRDLYGYACNGTIPPQYLDRGMRGLWRSMKDGVDKDFSKYREKSKKNSEAAKARGEKQTQKDDVSDVQTDANALHEMRTHTAASECMHSHPTNTNTDTSTATVTDTPCCIPLHRCSRSPLLKYSPLHGLMQAHRERHTSTRRKRGALLE